MALGNQGGVSVTDKAGGARLRMTSLWSDVFLVALFSTVLAWISIGNTAVRLANTIADDNPVVFSHFLADPSRWAGDVLGTYGHVFGYSSIQNWLPAFLYRHMGIEPSVPSIIFVYLQHVGLGVALYVLTLQFKRDRATAWGTVFFAFAASPWRWNLALYSSLMPWPYPGHLVMPLLLGAAVALIRGRRLATAGFLSVAALVHPSLTLFMIGAAALFYADEWRRWRTAESVRAILWLTLPAIICVVPALMFSPRGGEKLNASAMMEVLRANAHLNPIHDPRFWGTVVPAVIGYGTLLILSAQLPTFRASPGRRLVTAALIATAIFGLGHVAAMLVGIPLGAQLVGTRASQLVVFLSLPMVIEYLLQKVREPQAVSRAAGVTLLVLLSIQQGGLYWGPLLTCLMLDFASGVWRLPLAACTLRGRLRTAGAAVMVTWSAGVMIAALIGRLGGGQLSARPVLAILAPGTYFSAIALGTTLLVATLAVALWQDDKRERAIARWVTYAMSPIALGVIAVSQAVIVGQATSVPLARANYDAQRWSREHSLPGELFLIAVPELPWRTESHRRVVRMVPEGQYVYSGSRFAKEQYFDRVKALLARYPRESPVAVQAFASAYHASYVVRERSSPLSMPVAYANSELVVYRVPAADAESRVAPWEECRDQSLSATPPAAGGKSREYAPSSGSHPSSEE